MEQYIKKSALVAEIESLRKYYIERDDYDNGWNFALNKILSLIDTLEVKEYSEEYDGFLGKELKMVDDEIARLEKLKVKEVDLDDKGEWKNTGGFGSTWDPDSPDYCPD